MENWKWRNIEWTNQFSSLITIGENDSHNSPLVLYEDAWGYMANAIDGVSQTNKMKCRSKIFECNF